MSASGLALVLTAAVLHATWNFVVKDSGDRLLSSWAIVSVAGLVNVVVLAVAGLPESEALIFLPASMALHVGYNTSLAEAYDRVDLSVAYPIARGTAPLLVTVGGVAWLDDEVAPLGWLGVALIAVGLFALAASRFRARGLHWAFLTGLLIAGYTVVDGAAVRAGDEAVRYLAASFVLQAIGMTVVAQVRRGRPAMSAALHPAPWRLLFAGLAGFVAYLFVLIAARTNPIGLVAGTRELSALIGVALGWRLLHERVTTIQLLGACLSVGGTIAIALS
ncbi:MAG: EamA family transporter [Acidimicrobiales bacterium]